LLDVLVIGAGPYGLAAAKAARDKGLETRVLGRHMAFWREHMPAGMFLRSGPDWHLDPAYELTLERFLALHGETPDPLPIGLFLAYTEWFTEQAQLAVEDERVIALRPGFEAELSSGETIRARQVVAAPGIAHFTHRPEWAAAGDHTCDLVDLKALNGARVLIVGGRQSAYEWAALAVEHGAAHVDVVHRHPRPRFERVSWRFVDPLIDATLATDGWWRRLPQSERDAIARRFWEVGRLTLEHWLEPRLEGVDVHPETSVIDPGRFRPDRIVFATGYQADLDRVPYLRGLGIATRNGFPVLDAHMQTSVPGLYVPGFAATQDFGPFFGFVKGAPAAAELMARDLG
jgi:FAD-dependent urate hydroxylase